MQLLLIRHALPERRENTDGPADPDLTEDGHRQAEHLAAYLATEPIHAVYTSPMRRARQTAEPLARALGVEPVVVDGVAEFDRNASEYIPLEELKAAGDPRFLDYMSSLDQADDPAEFVTRVVSSIGGIIDAHPGENAAVVCHGGVINTFVASVLGLPTEPPGFFYPNYTSIHRVAASRSGIRSIVTLNETSFLRGTGLPMGLLQQG
ncbi:MAG: histidine phosphatase family protein [Ilumatobacter sp.]|nr:histidine phosphatase family protein [Ilumatobacter sp.]